MWKCPKCGRSFKNTAQSHYCGEAPLTIEEYILSQAENVRPYLYQVNSSIKDALPYATGKISWSMPTYWQNRNLIQFAALKNYIGLYPGVAVVEAFADRLSEYKVVKAAIHLPYDKDIPTELIADIAKWCEAQFLH